MIIANFDDPRSYKKNNSVSFGIGYIVCYIDEGMYEF